MYILDIKDRLEDCYECAVSPYKTYWHDISEGFLKVYKEYTGCDYPIYASIGSSRYIITEKPIEKIKKEIRENLEVLSSQKNDKRIIIYEDIICCIRTWLINDKVVLKKVDYEDIDKGFMTGEGVAKKFLSLEYKYSPFFVLDSNECIYHAPTRNFRIPYMWNSSDNRYDFAEIFLSND